MLGLILGSQSLVESTSTISSTSSVTNVDALLESFFKIRDFIEKQVKPKKRD
jgi:hypothetical protein